MKAVKIVSTESEGLCWLQVLSPSGKSWVDSIGTKDVDAVFRHKKYIEDNGDKCRVVTKVIQVIEQR